MKPLVLIGGGGHCKSCIDVIQSKAEYHPVGIIDKKTHKKRMCLDVPVLGTDKDMEFILTKYANALITVGQIKTSTIRENLFKKAFVGGFVEQDLFKTFFVRLMVAEGGDDEG